MTRSAADAAAMLRAIAGADADDPTASHEPVADYLGVIGQGVREVRVGIDRALIAAGADVDMVRATEEAARALAEIGARIQEVSFPPRRRRARSGYLSAQSKRPSRMKPPTRARCRIWSASRRPVGDGPQP